MKFSTFTPIAFAGIKNLPETLQDRCIIIHLLRALPGEAKAHLTDGDSAVLIECRRKLMRFADDLEELPTVELPPSLANRAGDNWRTMLRIAALASGDWPEVALRAATDTDDEDLSVLVRLLDAIWWVFKEQGVVRMHTKDLINALINVDEGEWKEAYAGRPISDYWLRGILAPILPRDEKSKKAREWREGSTGSAKMGYAELHFANAWQRYLLRDVPSKSEDVTYMSRTGGVIGGDSSPTLPTGGNNPAVSVGYVSWMAPDGSPDNPRQSRQTSLTPVLSGIVGDCLGCHRSHPRHVEQIYFKRLNNLSGMSGMF